MSLENDNGDVEKDRRRSRLVQALRILAGVVVVLFGTAIVVGRFMNINVVQLTVTGIWDTLVRWVGLF